jgi:glycosyltransferase involved in cell wall biosynthesis
VANDPSIDPVWALLDWGSTSLPLVGANWSLRSSFTAFRRLKSAGPPLDGALYHTQTCALLAPLVARAVPVFISTDATPRNVDSLRTAYEHRVGGMTEERAKGWAVARALRSAQRVFPWSLWAARSVEADYGVNPSKIVVVQPGLHLANWPVGPSRNEPPVRLLFVGGDFERKGGFQLLASCRALQGDWLLDVVTRTPIAADARIRVHTGLEPTDPALANLYRQADIFVLPTLGDTHSWATLEAMASGLPVVASPVGALPEIVQDGHSGLLVPAGDVASLTSALQRLIDDPELRLRMGRSARELAERDHDGDHNFAGVLADMKAVADQRFPAGTLGSRRRGRLPSRPE